MKRLHLFHDFPCGGLAHGSLFFSLPVITSRE